MTIPPQGRKKEVKWTMARCQFIRMAIVVR
jgi:hypothetical protein